jgi:glycerol-3-phosphate dehydrogenase
MERFDVIIIGAGMTGCMLARELSFYRVDVAVMERSSYVCGGQSKANGAIIHGGHDPEPGTFKARMNLEGNAAFQGLCEELGVSFHRTGIWVIAFDGTELAVLRELLARGEGSG